MANKNVLAGIGAVALLGATNYVSYEGGRNVGRKQEQEPTEEAQYFPIGK